MKNGLIKVIALIVVMSTMLTLMSCTKKNDEPVTTTVAKVQTKPQTSQTVKIVNVPKDKTEILKMLNSALDYVEVYCYKYTKTAKCSVSGISVGTLSSASNSYDAFSSIFGEKDVANSYDYKAAKEEFDKNFVKSGFTNDECTSADAKQDNDELVLTVNLAGQANPTDKGVFGKLGGDYLSTEAVKNNLADFGSSAKSVSVYASDITLVARISVDDSSLQALEVRYTEKYSLSGVTLVKLAGDSVSGTSSTVVKYSDIG